MRTQTATEAGPNAPTGTARPATVTREIHGPVRTHRPARVDDVPDDTTGQWNIVLGED
ncbi:hypothetical protein ACLGI4_13935 [Streptomyces sp. HMX112]|uniref:hypothetical protein n=1 Tax=Streptomyces sp. HMX112 TaxID=3390850 RepID=UPI003A8122CF